MKGGGVVWGGGVDRADGWDVQIFVFTKTNMPFIATQLTIAVQLAVHLRTPQGRTPAMQPTTPPDSSSRAPADANNSLLSSLYFAAGAATGLVEGYMLLCRTLANELTNGRKGLTDGGQCDDQEAQVDEVVLSQQILKRIASIPRGLSAEELSSQLQQDPVVRASLPEGVQLHLDFVTESGEVLPVDEVAHVRWGFVIHPTALKLASRTGIGIAKCKWTGCDV